MVTNALAHAVVTALAIGGCRRLDDVESVATDLTGLTKLTATTRRSSAFRTTEGLEVTAP